MLRSIRKTIHLLVAAAVVIVIAESSQAEDKLSEINKDPLLSAMRAELSRAQKELRLPDQPAPYFIEFWVQESSTAYLTGKYGGITQQHPDLHPARQAGVQVRVGSYESDNTNLPLNMRYDRASYADYQDDNTWRVSMVPMDGDEQVLRAALWAMSDTAYKRAIGDYQKKKGMTASGMEQEKDKADDFSRETPQIVLEPVADPGLILDDSWKDLIRKVTDFLAKQPDIMDPLMSIQMSRDVNYYMNTEGTVVRSSAIIYNINISAWIRTEDGAKVSDFRHVLVRDPKDLPDFEKLLAEAKAMAQELQDLRKAEEFTAYTGPAILVPDVAGVFFHEALGHRLEGERQRMPESGQTFKGKIGEKILSEQITVSDDPTLDKFKGKSLVGHYRYDDEGVAAQKVTLIEKGRLKNYLMSRTPINGFLRSNGHGRSQNPGYLSYNGHAIGRMANLIVASSNTVSEKKLKAKLMAEAKKQGKPYGLIIRHIYGGDTNTQAPDPGAGGERYQAFKATPVLVYAVDANTGNERLVRGVELVGTPLSSLEKVVAAGDDPEAFNGMCGAESGWIPVSVISPSILTAQVELQRKGGSRKKAPILLSPFQVKAQGSREP